MGTPARTPTAAITQHAGYIGSKSHRGTCTGPPTRRGAIDAGAIGAYHAEESMRLQTVVETPAYAKRIAQDYRRRT